MWSKYTRDLDNKYGWNDPFLTSRTLSQLESVIGSNRKGHRSDSTSPVLHGK
jgi:hypothetical protein